MSAIAAAAALSEAPAAPMSPSLNDEEWLRILQSLPHDKIACLPITVAIASIVVSLVAVGLRLYTRYRLLRNLGFDDVCAALAAVRAASQHPPPHSGTTASSPLVAQS